MRLYMCDCQEFLELQALTHAPGVQPHPQYLTDILVQDMGMQSAVAHQSLCMADIADFICHGASVTHVTIFLCGLTTWHPCRTLKFFRWTEGLHSTWS